MELDLGLQNQTDLPCVSLSSGYYSRNAEIGYHQVVHTIFNEIEPFVAIKKQMDLIKISNVF